MDTTNAESFIARKMFVGYIIKPKSQKNNYVVKEALRTDQLDGHPWEMEQTCASIAC